MFSLSLSRFGYAARHSISYDPRSKPGLVTLWCSFSGSLPAVGADPIRNGDDFLTEVLVQLSSTKGGFGTTVFVSFSVGSDDDLFSILAAILMIKSGKDYSFKNFAGREISFSHSQAGNNKQEVVLVHIQHKSEIGIMTLKEINEFEIVTRRILAELGYSKQQVVNTVQLLMTPAFDQESEQEDGNARNAGQV
jgi:hypothetical protein